METITDTLFSGLLKLGVCIAFLNILMEAITAPLFSGFLIGSLFNCGEVSEWLKEHAWKACGCRKVAREFESLPLRFFLEDIP